jgi:Na+-transporting methylmalonyl-CoA/oxaloacetate decarboxylase gamma subunit
MMAPAKQYRAWAIASIVVAATTVLLLAWAYHWLGDTRYGGVATIDETISHRTDEPTPEITSSLRVSQTFIATDNDLTEVQVFLATYARENTATLVMTLRDESGSIVARGEAGQQTIANNAYHPFIFDRIADSLGETYEVTLTSPNGKTGNAFTAWTGNCDCYPAGELSITGTPQPDKDLAMRVNYHHDGVVTWRELLDRMSQYKPLIFKGAGLVLLALLSMAFALAALGAFTLSVVPRAEDQRDQYAKPLWIGAALVVAIIVLLLTGAYEGIGI